MTTELMGLVDAVKAATGQDVHKNTVANWGRKGVKGVRLRVWKLGGRRLTTVDAVREFVAASSEQDDEQRKAKAGSIPRAE